MALLQKPAVEIRRRHWSRNTDGLDQSIYRRFKPDIGDNEGTIEGRVINGLEKEQEISSTSSWYSSDQGLLVAELNSACFMVLDYVGEKTW